MTDQPSIHQHPLAYLVALEGVALMKAFGGEFDAAFTQDRLAELRRLLDAAETFGDGVDVPPMSAVDAYDAWSATYDDPGNGIFEIEEPWLYDILDALPVGDAVDAACGTGRVTAHLAGLGHRVRGVDASPGMLAKARAKLPDVTFTEGSVQALPLPDDSSDLVTCCLSLAHVGELAPAFAEFARVLRPGGHLVITDTRSLFVGSRRYPLVKWLADGSFGYLPTWHHPTSDYLKAALPLGFAVRGCEEPPRLHDVADPEEAPEPLGDPGDPPDVWALHSWAPDAANATYRDHPALVVWDFQLEA